MYFCRQVFRQDALKESNSMILYFSGTGNSLAISRQLAERLQDSVMPLSEAAHRNLMSEKRIGLVYPSYWFNAPRAVLDLIPRLRLSSDAYVFIIIPCGAQAGNAIWNVGKILSDNGIHVAYSNKIRVPDNSAIGFGRNPNDQVWKFERYASRLERIAKDIAAEVHSLHYAWWGPIGALCARPFIQKRTLPMLTPTVSPEKCNGCGVCINVCPRENIVKINGKAHCESNCTQCLACVHFCPMQAVELRDKSTLKERQYHHPLVKLSDLMRNDD
ncbi:MAG: EFR1 family ferrodoxin [Bacteroidales bacterium]|nr:EFR1 family ferrodoxin [Bacteroidales bacterium]